MLDILLAFLGSLSLSILFNVDYKKFFWVGMSGSLGWFFFVWINGFTGQPVFSTFIGAIVVGIYSETMARILKSPSTVFSVTGILPLVPGIGIYEAAKYIIDIKYSQAVVKSFEVLASAGAIALGIMLISALFGLKKGIKSSRKMPY